MADRIPTLADICSAIAEGHISVSSDGLMYQVSALELRRYFNSRSGPLPTPVSQDSSPRSDANTCSTCSNTSVA